MNVANFKLGPPDGYDPEGGVLIHGRIVTATSVMTPKDVLITLFDCGPRSAPAPLPRCSTARYGSAQVIAPRSRASLLFR